MTARRVALAFLLFASGGAAACSGRASQPESSLRVCADPNNLPFSDSTGAGFENRLASLVAAEMKARVTYTWWAQRRGFVRNTLKLDSATSSWACRPASGSWRSPQPYYRSSYVFVSRRDRKLDVRSFDDPVLRRLTVGVQLVGDDYANAPPAHALTRRRRSIDSLLAMYGAPVLERESAPHFASGERTIKPEFQ